MGDLTRTKLGSYDVTWGGLGLGFTDTVDVSKLKINTKPIKVGSIGDVILGQRIISMEGTISVEIREIDRTLYNKILPWYSSGAIALLPATVHKDLYDYADLLTLHPSDGNSTNEDINLVKAYPMVTLMKRNGNDDDKVIVEFGIFPDRAQLPTRVYGYVGPVPS